MLGSTGGQGQVIRTISEPNLICAPAIEKGKIEIQNGKLGTMIIKVRC